MLCSSSTLARLDWLCNGNWRFITPAGVANHRRREALGGERMSRGGLHECPALTTSDWLTRRACSLTHRYTDWHASSHTCKHVHSDMATHAPCMPPSTQRPSWEDVRKTSHISSSVSLLFLSCMCERLKTEKWICRWPKITIRMKRKRGCVCPLLQVTEWRITEWKVEQRARKTRQQSCYIKFLLGPFHLTKPSLLLSFAADGEVRRTCSGHTLNVIFKKMRINKRQSLKTFPLSFPKVMSEEFLNAKLDPFTHVAHPWSYLDVTEWSRMWECK